jgi:hypothetical protein
MGPHVGSSGVMESVTLAEDGGERLEDHRKFSEMGRGGDPSLVSTFPVCMKAHVQITAKKAATITQCVFSMEKNVALCKRPRVGGLLGLAVSGVSGESREWEKLPT